MVQQLTTERKEESRSNETKEIISYSKNRISRSAFRIDNTELCLKLMWKNYHLERDPFKRFQMLKDIIMVQPYLSFYYEASKIFINTRYDLVDNIKNLDKIIIYPSIQDKIVKNLEP